MIHFVVHWHDRLPSTNTCLKEWARDDSGVPEGTIVAARQQDAGRGRRGRGWYSAPNRDLAFSLLLRPDVSSERLPSLPLLAALAVAEALDAYDLDARVKWPNDVRVDGRKISGILVESVPDLAEGYVVGIGVNVNSTPAELAQVGQPATSIATECAGDYRLESVLELILDRFALRYAAWLREGFAAMRDAWLARAEAFGREVTIRNGVKTFRGIPDGITPTGALLLRDSRGIRHTVYAGDLDLDG